MALFTEDAIIIYIIFLIYLDNYKLLFILFRVRDLVIDSLQFIWNSF